MILTPKVQEKLFELSRKRYPDWSTRQISGYVHGIVDGLTRKQPRRVYERDIDKPDRYACGYMYGFYDANGATGCVEIWGQKSRMIEHRWWEKCLNETDNG